MEEMTHLERLTEAKARQKVINIDDKVEATFGPNPCTQLHLQTDDNEHFYMACDNKRCVYCGPRKEMIIWLQIIQGLGDVAYVERIEPGIGLAEVERGLERVKSDVRRGKGTSTYQIVGDATLGHIVVSNRPLTPNARRMNLDDWRKRIIDMYHHSVQRIRRSYDLGRVTLVTLRRKGKSGQSPWSRVQEYQNKRQMAEQAIIDDRDAATGDIGWHVWEEGNRLLSTIDMWRGSHA